MKAEIISIGSELLSGQTINTNLGFLGKELQSLGFNVEFQTTVNDKSENIKLALSTALNRADLIITSGGLGPTHDDLTHEAICSFFRLKSVLDKAVLKKIKKKFTDKGYKKMPKINIKQAYKPKNARWIQNKLGTANGMILKINKKIVMTFPGIPCEMQQMWSDTGKNYLKKLTTNASYSKTLKFTGIGESALAERIKNFFSLKNPVVAPYASIGEVKIQITGHSATRETAKMLVNKTTKAILKKSRQYYYGSDNETLEALLAKKLSAKKKTIAIAESCTGGLLSKRLTDIPKSSEFINLNVVTYSNEAKNKILSVSKEILKKYGAVSSQTAANMAAGIKNLSKSHIGFSITGIAGPSGGTKTKPVGLVYFGLAKGNKVKTKMMQFGTHSTREEIRWLATQFALSWLVKIV